MTAGEHVCTVLLVTMKICDTAPSHNLTGSLDYITDIPDTQLCERVSENPVAFTQPVATKEGPHLIEFFLVSVLCRETMFSTPSWPHRPYGMTFLKLSCWEVLCYYQCIASRWASRVLVWRNRECLTGYFLRGLVRNSNPEPSCPDASQCTIIAIYYVEFKSSLFH